MSVAVTTHVAAALGPDKLQRCLRCGVVLKDFRGVGIDTPPWAEDLGPREFGVVYPVGAAVDVGDRWFALRLSPVDEAQLCVPVFASLDELSRFVITESARIHAELYPIGCPRNCEACEARLAEAVARADGSLRPPTNHPTIQPKGIHHE